MPYANALATAEAAINLCPPGGVRTLQALGALLCKDPKPFEAEMAAKAKPAATVTIREAECIGCAKCIKACPVDAILGSAKHMHVVLTDQCTGCELCVPACPVDCIDIVPIKTPPHDAEKAFQANLSRQRFERRNERLERLAAPLKPIDDAATKRKAYLEAALLRAKTKRGKC